MEQKEAIAKLAEQAHNDGALIVSEIGSQTVWLHDTGDHPSHLYLSGPMGMAPSVALGAALANPDKPVLALCGDGALVMNLTSLVTISQVAPANLTLALLDNGVYDFTGAVFSPSQTVDWATLIKGLKGFKHYENLGVFKGFSADYGLRFVHCPVKPASGKAKLFPLTPPQIHRRFKAYIQDV